LAVIAAWVHWSLAIAPAVLLAFVLFFFRDPPRRVPREPGLLVAPADGTVAEVSQLDHDEFIGGPAVRIGIFLSIFNVHINRSPCDAKVLPTIYKPGKFINAMHHGRASDENESNTVVLGEVQSGKPVAVVRQIVGLIARWIIF